MFASLGHPANAKKSINVTPLPIITSVSSLQSLNADLPIDVTLSGIVTLVSPVHM